MSLFFDTPEATQISILTTWLEWKDIVQLDTAVCSQKRRSEFRKVITSASCRFTRTFWYKEERGPLLEWIVARQCRLEHLVINRMHLEDETFRRKAFTVCGPGLKSLTIHLSNETWHADSEPDDEPSEVPSNFEFGRLFRDLHQRCPNVHTLYIDGSTYETSLTTIGKKFLIPVSIQSLRLYDLPLTVTVLTSICLSAHLQSLELFRCDLPVNAIKQCGSNAHVRTFKSAHMHLCCLFPSITHLELQCVDASKLGVIVKLCPCLVDVNMNIRAGSRSSHVLQLVGPHWPDLRSLTIEGRGVYIADTVVLAIIANFPKLRTLANMVVPRQDHFHNVEGTVPTMYPVNYSGSQLCKLAMKCNEASTLQLILERCLCLNKLYLRQPCKSCNSYPLERPNERIATTDPVEQSLHCIAHSNVRELRLNDYTSLRDVDIPCLHYTKIEVLHIAGSTTYFTTTALLALLPTLRHLHTLDLTQCKNISEHVVPRIPELCKSLRDLTYSNYRSCYCDNPGSKTPSLIEQLMRRLYPQLRKCYIYCSVTGWFCCLTLMIQTMFAATLLILTLCKRLCCYVLLDM